MAKLRALMIGAGGMAGVWIRQFLPAFRDRLEIAGLVDVVPEVLADSGQFLGLGPHQCFTGMEEAFSRVQADFCIIVVPPAFHQRAVELACAHQLNILSEKPIADTWEACVAVYKAVRQACVRMTVMQNYRYNAPMLTMKAVLAEERLGKLNYIVARFAEDYRVRNSWGKFRHEISHSLLVEGGIHHLDQIRNLTGGDCVRVWGKEWRPDWAADSFDGESCGLYTLEMDNGVYAQYEGNCVEAAEVNGWHHELYRAECSKGSVSLGADGIVRLRRHTGGGRITTEELANTVPSFQGHSYVIDAYLRWLEGGSAPDTVIEDNIKSNALLFAAIDASVENRVVALDEKLAFLR